MQKRRAGGLTAVNMYRREVWKLQKLTFSARELCRGYDSGQYVQEKGSEGMTVLVEELGSISRRILRRVRQWAVCVVVKLQRV